MRWTFAYAALVGFLAAAPLTDTHQYGRLDIKHEEAAVKANITAAADTWGLHSFSEAPKRREVSGTLISRGGIPKLGDKPDVPKDRDPIPAPGAKPGKGPDEGAGSAPGGSAPPPVFADANLEKAREKGAGIGSALDDAIFKNLPDATRKDVPGLGYTVAGKDKIPFEAIPKQSSYLTDMGIRVDNQEWREIVIWRKGTDTVSSQKLPILATSSDTTQGVLIVKQSYKDRDQVNPQASFTDLVNHSWMTSNNRRGGDPKNIRYIAQDNIQFEPTIDSAGIALNTPPAIDSVFAKLKADPSKALVIPAKSDDVNVKASFELLEAQTHVARVLQWFKDFHTTLGDPKIAALHLTKQSDHPSGIYSIVIEIGH